MLKVMAASYWREPGSSALADEQDREALVTAAAEGWQPLRTDGAEPSNQRTVLHAR